MSRKTRWPLASSRLLLAALCVFAVAGLTRVALKGATVRGDSRAESTVAGHQAAELRCGRDTVGGVPYRFCDLSPDRTRLELYWLNEASGGRIGSIASLDRMLSAQGQRLVFGMNAGMYDTTARSAPVGLYVQDGKELVPLNTRDGCCNFYHKPNGVFYISRGRAAVVETGEFKRSGVHPDIATQSGPLLVQRGRFPHADYSPTGPTNAPRNAVGVRPNGTVALIIADGPTNMHTFRTALRDHFGLRDALYLDGAVSRFYVAPGAPPDGSELGPILAVLRPVR